MQRGLVDIGKEKTTSVIIHVFSTRVISETTRLAKGDPALPLTQQHRVEIGMFSFSGVAFSMKALPAIWFC